MNMKNVWRFFNGEVSGIVLAESEAEAIERANYYLSIQFDDIGEDAPTTLVWAAENDDDFRTDCPYALATNY